MPSIRVLDTVALFWKFAKIERLQAFWPRRGCDPVLGPDDHASDRRSKYLLVYALLVVLLVCRVPQ